MKSRIVEEERFFSVIKFMQKKMCSIGTVLQTVCLNLGTERNGQMTAYWAGNSGLCLWKEQEFKIVEEVCPTLFFIFRGGHTSSTILNSCSFRRWRLSFRNLYSILLTQALCIELEIYNLTLEENMLLPSSRSGSRLTFHHLLNSIYLRIKKIMAPLTLCYTGYFWSFRHNSCSSNIIEIFKHFFGLGHS